MVEKASDIDGLETGGAGGLLGGEGLPRGVCHTKLTITYSTGGRPPVPITPPHPAQPHPAQPHPAQPHPTPPRPERQACTRATAAPWSSATAWSTASARTPMTTRR
jgi:hypothetical protein